MTTKISIPILRTIGALPDTVYALFVLIIIDYITGVCLAVSEQKISSKIGTKGIAAKVLIVCFVTLKFKEHLTGLKSKKPHKQLQLQVRRL